MPWFSRNANHRRSLWLSEKDIEAATRLLEILARDPGTSDPRGQSEGAVDRKCLLERANALMALRQRRVALLGPKFATDAPFDMLVALYAAGSIGDIFTARQLRQVADLTEGTTARWLHELVKEGWVTKAAVKTDARMVQLSLTPKAVEAVEQLLSWDD